MTPRSLFHGGTVASTKDVDDSLAEKTVDSFTKFKTVAQRLEALYGTGDNPQLRRKLYQRIQRCTIEHGPDCYDVVRACVSAAASASAPARYFCVAITAELKALEYWTIPADF